MSEKEKVTKILYKDIKDEAHAIELFHQFKRSLLELRLSSKQQHVINFGSQKAILKKNIARLQTYFTEKSILKKNTFASL